MKDFHIIVGKDNATHVSNALSENGFTDFEVLCLEDDLSFGPLRNPEVPFSLLRHSFWQNCSANQIIDSFQDLEHLLELKNTVLNLEDSRAVFWLNNKGNELLWYYLILHYFKSLQGKLYVLNINGLPFLDDTLQLFYPSTFVDINNRGIGKALKLARVLTISEMETDADEWKFFQNEGKDIRSLKGGKRFECLEIVGFDQKIIDTIQTYPQKKWPKLIQLLSPNANRWEQMFYSSRLNYLLEHNIISSDNNYYTIINADKS